MKAAAQTEKPRGTVIAEKARAKANKFSDRKRDSLLEQGMAIIYGETNRPKSGVPRG